MDSLEKEKIQAMKRYQRGTQEHKLLSRVPNFVNYAVATLIFGLFVSSPAWVPDFLSNLMLFLSASLPNVASFLLGPKFLFIICNLIVFVLVSESKFSRSPSARDTYEEKVRNNLSHRRFSPDDTSLVEDEGREIERDEEVCDVEEEGDAVELHKRVEDFIEKVKCQRRVEAKVFLCY